MTTKSVVSIAKGTDVGKMVEEALSLLAGVETLLKPNSTVVISIGNRQPPDSW